MGRSTLNEPHFAHNDDQQCFVAAVSAENIFLDRDEEAAFSPSLSRTLIDHAPLASPLDPLLASPCEGPDGGGLDAGVLSTMPGDIVHSPLPTPQDPEMRIVSGVNHFIGGPLAILPTSAPPPAASMAREGPAGLRLPSFQQLGIAAPHPDRLVSPDLRDDPATYSVFEGLDVAAGAQLGPGSVKSATPRAVQSPVFHFVNPLTPPVERGPVSWTLQPAVQTEGLHSPPVPDESIEEETTTSVEDTTQAMDAMAIVPEVTVSEGDGEAGSGNQQWSEIDGAVDVLLQNLHSALRPSSPIFVLSHALPSTSTTGHHFPKVIDAIYGSSPNTPATPMTWINVFHAIPGRFNLADLPTSPPNTPGPAVGGDDYFTQKTFEHAVSISDYQIATPVPRGSPRPVVAPSSIDVSIVERYIPPSTPHEFREMFDPNGSSILVDRMVELSPNNGSLLFIYPTKRGAEFFMRDYLGPVLDPLLRSMSVVEGLSAEMCRNIGTMAAVPSMLSHEDLDREIRDLCTKLSNHSTAAQRFHPGGQKPQFSVTYAAPHRLRLTRGVWAREWWTKQEKIRIKEILAHHLPPRDLSRRSGAKEFGVPATTGTVLLQTLLGGVIGKAALEKEVPAGDGIEVGVFLVKRSR